MLDRPDSFVATFLRLPWTIRGIIEEIRRIVRQIETLQKLTDPKEIHKNIQIQLEWIISWLIVMKQFISTHNLWVGVDLVNPEKLHRDFAFPNELIGIMWALRNLERLFEKINKIPDTINVDTSPEALQHFVRVIEMIKKRMGSFLSDIHRSISASSHEFERYDQIFSDQWRQEVWQTKMKIWYTLHANSIYLTILYDQIFEYLYSHYHSYLVLVSKYEALKKEQDTSEYISAEKKSETQWLLQELKVQIKMKEENILQEVQKLRPYVALAKEGKLLSDELYASVVRSLRIVFSLKQCIQDFETEAQRRLYWWVMLLEDDESEHDSWFFSDLEQQIRSLQSWIHEDIAILGTRRIMTVWDQMIISAKRKVFECLDQFFILPEPEDEQWNSKFLRDIFLYFKPLTSDEYESDTFHYALTFSSDGGIDGLRAEHIPKPPRTVGATIAMLNRKISQIIRQDPESQYLQHLFPGKDNSLDGNILLMGPYWTGKTAFLRELAHNSDFATIHVVTASLKSKWYGVFEKNIPELYKRAQELSEKTWKHVFIVVDEFDQLVNPGDAHGWNQTIGAQKTLQELLDGISAYPRVHLIGLTNEPRSIPPAIIRRMNSFVTQKLTDREIRELITSRFESIGFDENCIQENLWKLRWLTPKMIASICEKAYDLFLLRIEWELWRSGIATFVSGMKSLSSAEERKRYFESHQQVISHNDFSASLHVITSEPTFNDQIETYNDFYKYLEWIWFI